MRSIADLITSKSLIADIERRLEAAMIGRGFAFTSEQILIVAGMPDQPTTISSLEGRCYSGTNISYNLRRLEEAGLIRKERSPHDGRSILVARTAKGEELARLAHAHFERVDRAERVAA